MDRIPELGETLYFIRCHVSEIRLVICIGTCHKFCMFSVIICQVIIPCISQILQCPLEHLFARCNMMVCNMNSTTVTTIIISSEEIISGRCRKIRISFNGIRMTADICFFFMILYCIPSFGNREGCMVTVIVMMYITNILWEEQLIIFIYMDRSIFPPHKRMFYRCSVVKFYNCFIIGCIRCKADSISAFYAILSW